MLSDDGVFLSSITNVTPKYQIEIEIYLVDDEGLSKVNHRKINNASVADWVIHLY